jgi:GntR family transcriptional regulator
VPYLEIAGQVREQIKSGELAVGDQLKTVRALAAEHGVAQGTVASALDVLRSEGLIDTVRGKGSVVIAVPDETATSSEYVKLESALRDVLRRLDKLEGRLEELEGDS